VHCLHTGIATIKLTKKEDPAKAANNTLTKACKPQTDTFSAPHGRQQLQCTLKATAYGMMPKTKLPKNTVLQDAFSAHRPYGAMSQAQ